MRMLLNHMLTEGHLMYLSILQSLLGLMQPPTRPFIYAVNLI